MFYFLLLQMMQFCWAEPVSINVGPAGIESPSDIEIVPVPAFARAPEQVLQNVPGVAVTKQGGAGQPVSVFIRGAESSGTLVLLDGLPLNDPSSNNKAFDFSSLNLGNVERVEVTKGPQSVVYGSGATGGVINIVTRKGAGPLKLLSVAEVGSFNTTSVSETASGSQGPWSYSLSAAGFRTNGISAATGSDLERDGSSIAEFSARVGWRPTSRSEVEAIVRDTHKFAKLDYAPSNTGPYFMETDSPNYRSQSELRTLALKGFHQWDSSLESHWLASRFAQDRDYENDRSSTNSAWLRGHYTGENYHVENVNRWRVLPKISLSFGANVDWESGASEWLTDSSAPALAARQSTWLAGMMARGQYEGSRLFLTVGARADHHSVFGEHTAYEVAPGAHLTSSTDLFLRVASAYKAPTLYQLYAPVFGNAGLKPERVQGAEVSVVQNFARFKLEATAFSNQMQNLIQFAKTYVNVGSARARGLELWGEWQLRPVNFSVGYTYLETRDDGTGESLVRRPNNSLSAKLRAALTSSLQTELVYFGVDRRRDNDPLSARPTTVAGYEVLGASVHWQPLDAWKFFLRGENILDRQYEEIAGYSAQPFSLYGGFSYLFETAR